MKRVFIFILIFFAFVLSAQDNANFKTVYDDVDDVTTVTHKNMEYNMGMYNLRDNIYLKTAVST